MTAQSGKVLAVVTLLHKSTLLLHSNHRARNSLPLRVCRPAVESALPSGRKEVSCHSRLIGSFAILTSHDPISPLYARQRYTLLCHSPWTNSVKIKELGCWDVALYNYRRKNTSNERMHGHSFD